MHKLIRSNHEIPEVYAQYIINQLFNGINYNELSEGDFLIQMQNMDYLLVKPDLIRESYCEFTLTNQDLTIAEIHRKLEEEQFNSV